jgi:class 3 adenylate cyclase
MAAIERYDGFVAQYLGDGVLAYFGYCQAVRAGLKFAEEIALLPVEGAGPLAARVGIATGLVVLEDLTGTGSSQERSIAGETPNLAARLQAMADIDTVVIADATRRLLGGDFVARTAGWLGLVHIKDRPGPAGSTFRHVSGRTPGRRPTPQG